MAVVRENVGQAMLRARWVGGVGDTIPLTRSPIRIGRSAENDILVDHEAISGRHLELGFLHGAWVVRDLGSTNGTWLEGSCLSAHVPVPLSYHATVCLSNVLELCLLPPSQSVSGIQTPERMHFVRDVRPGLIILQRNGEMQRVPLNKPTTILGRSSRSDIVIDQGQVSGQHAQVVAQGRDRYQIVDLGSSHGLVQSGQRIDHKTLIAGDRFTIGDQVLIEYQPALGFVTQVSGVRQSHRDRALYSANRLHTCPGCGAINYGPHNECLSCHTRLR
jgi:pSer/pThr/pTyr-binding forkhead associated (FHA) protein